MEELPVDPNVDFQKLANDAFLSAIKSDLGRICTVYVSACAEAGLDEAALAKADEALRRGLASNRALLERGRRVLGE